MDALLERLTDVDTMMTFVLPVIWRVIAALFQRLPGQCLLNLTVLGCPEGRSGLKFGSQTEFCNILARVIQNVTKTMPEWPPGDAFGNTFGV